MRSVLAWTGRRRVHRGGGCYSANNRVGFVAQRESVRSRYPELGPRDVVGQPVPGLTTPGKGYDDSTPPPPPRAMWRAACPDQRQEAGSPSSGLSARPVIPSVSQRESAVHNAVDGARYGACVSDSVAVLASLVGAGGALLGAGTSALVTYFVTRRAVNAATVEADKTRAHERVQVRTEREQTRKLDTYVAITRYVVDWQRQVGFMVNQATFRTDPPPPAPQQDSIDYALEARAELIASAEVRRLLHEFNSLIVRYGTAVGNAREMATYIVGPMPDPTVTTQAAEAQNAANEAGRAALTAGEPLVDRMRTELDRDSS